MISVDPDRRDSGPSHALVRQSWCEEEERHLNPTGYGWMRGFGGVRVSRAPRIDRAHAVPTFDYPSPLVDQTGRADQCRDLGLFRGCPSHALGRAFAHGR